MAIWGLKKARKLFVIVLRILSQNFYANIEHCIIKNRDARDPARALLNFQALYIMGF